MGCDIHMRIERRVDGQWVDVPYADSWDLKWRKDYWRPGEILLSDEFDGRNYDLFGILANVRNGTWGEEFTPIAEPRGWPPDSPTNPHGGDDDDENFWGGDHSFSWVTLAELEAYPWDGTTRKRGWVSHEQATQFRLDGKRPEHYSAAGNHGEYIEWDQDIRSDVRNWPDKFLPVLRMLGASDDVRLVFGFDN